MSKPNTTGEGAPSVSAPHEQVEVIVANLHARTAYERLPDCVFPVCATVRLDRRMSKDSTYRDIRPPEFPVHAKQSDSTPYIPDQKIHFYNPAEISNQSSKTWEYGEAVKRLNDAVAKVEEGDPQAAERFYLTGITLVEIQEEYVEYDDGGRAVASADMFTDRAEMNIGYFEKRPTVSNQKVKEKIQSAAPGNVKQPLRLTEIKTVYAKEHRGDDDTTAESTKRRYFTDGQAEQYNDLSLTPATYRLLDDVEPSERDKYRPLSPALDRVNTFFPNLLNASEFMHRIKFYGHLNDRSHFVEQDAVILTD
jgi:hypothetical protein